ncbi:hypothetical protein [Streptomyces acidicola]
MASFPLLAEHTPPHWLDDEQNTRGRRHTLVTARRDHLHISQ